VSVVDPGVSARLDKCCFIVPGAELDHCGALEAWSGVASIQMYHAASFANPERLGKSRLWLLHALETSNWATADTRSCPYKSRTP
jgi:hypothetical protein